MVSYCLCYSVSYCLYGVRYGVSSIVISRVIFPVISSCVIVSVDTVIGYLRYCFPLATVLHLLGYYGIDLVIQVGGAVSGLAIIGH